MAENGPSEPLVQKRHGLLHLGHPDAHVPGFEIPEATAPPASRGALVFGFLIVIALAWVGFMFEQRGHGVEEARVALPWTTPFVLLLAAIAIMPFVARHWWEDHYAKVSLALAAVIATFYLWRVDRGAGNLARTLAEYISFIFLLGSLFVVSGGILIRVRARATPLANTVLLLIGAVIANIFGTTGASMLLIRPYLRMNAGHVRPFHIVFFIFVVANVGGSLTPIGDPPLFLGYLLGVPFLWVVQHCWPIWLIAVGTLLAMFFILDTRAQRTHRREPYDGDDFGPAVSFYGGANLLFIALILIGILGHSDLNAWTKRALGFEAPWREMLMAVAAFGSLATTPWRVHAENHFNYAPIREVAFLFVGIFVTMLPALNYLYHAGGERGGGSLLRTPGQYYFTCGALSSVLDNAPTYLTFLKTELGSLPDKPVQRAIAIAKRPGNDVTEADLSGMNAEHQHELIEAINALVAYHGDRVAAGTLSEEEVRVGFLLGDPLLNRFLIAISMGAVLFGACTYIGNGPNFMVKSIAEHAGAPAPSFFGYIVCFTLPILAPVLLIVWWIFLR
jgi:Na+/H+ antiporter NhaD/arsenite permease-like protein